MKKFLRFFVALGSMFYCLSIAFAGIPNHSHPTTFVGPTLNLGFTSTINDMTAYGISGEGGPQNWRVGATLAFRLMENQRFKVGAEYLWQKIKYPFYSGNTTQWVHQGTIGAIYEYLPCGLPYQPILDVRGYVSHAPSKNLSTVTGTVVIDGVPSAFTDFRRIAGSNAAGISPGASISPWCGAKFGLDLNYDNVRYDTKYGRNRDAKGFGGTARFNQYLTENIRLDLLAAVRQPFNHYQATLNWMNIPYYGRWNLDLDGSYVVGKETLPNTWNIGLSASFYLDQRCEPFARKDFKGEIRVPVVDDFLEFAADPAIVPQVLAIPDERVEIPQPLPICSPVPTVIGTIPNQTGTGSVNASLAFSPSTGLTYTLTLSPVPTNGGTAVIDPTTGVVTFTSSGLGTDQTSTATVTATNACGSASTTFLITFEGD